MNADGRTCKITGLGAYRDTHVVIPETLDGYRVTGIAGYAFLGKESLISVTVPTSVTTIGLYAFRGCINLTTVYYKGSQARWKQIKLADEWKADSAISDIVYGDTAKTSPFQTPSQPVLKQAQRSTENADSQKKKFSKGLLYTANADCKTCRITGLGSCKDKTIVIPDVMGTLLSFRVTEIANGAFSDPLGSIHYSPCKKLESVTVPDSVTSIGDHAFKYCISLTSVILNASVTSIGKEAFKDCEKLTEIRYNGTKKQWKQIMLGNNWKSGSGIKKVECTDGAIRFLF